MNGRTIIRFIKKAIRWHRASFDLFALPAFLWREYSLLYDWFDMAYRCVREYRASQAEVGYAYIVLRELLDYFTHGFGNGPLHFISDFEHWLYHGK